VVDAPFDDHGAGSHLGVRPVQIERDDPVVEADDRRAAPLQFRKQQLFLYADAGHQHADRRVGSTIRSLMRGEVRSTGMIGGTSQDLLSRPKGEGLGVRLLAGQERP
jgi:hypothetical protein